MAGTAQAADPAALTSTTIRGTLARIATPVGEAPTAGQTGGVSATGGIWARAGADRVSIEPLVARPTTVRGELRVAGAKAARQTATGPQALAVLRGTRETAQWRLRLPAGVQTVALPDGSIGFQRGTKALAMRLDTPWAVDSDGQRLKTSYVVAGGVITQLVDTRTAVFPVVADPKLTYGAGVYLNMWGFEVRAAGVAFTSIAGWGGAAICAGLVKIKGAMLAWVMKAVCLVGGAKAADKLKAAIMVIWRDRTSIINSWCYQKKIWGPGYQTSYFHHVNARNCRR